MALVGWEMAFASIVLRGAPVAGEGAWATAPERAGPKQITKIAAGLRSTLPIFTVGSYSFEFGFMANAEIRPALALGSVLVALLDHRLTTSLRGRGARSYDPCAINYL